MTKPWKINNAPNSTLIVRIANEGLKKANREKIIPTIPKAQSQFQIGKLKRFIWKLLINFDRLEKHNQALKR